MYIEIGILYVILVIFLNIFEKSLVDYITRYIFNPMSHDAMTVMMYVVTLILVMMLGSHRYMSCCVFKYIKRIRRK